MPFALDIPSEVSSGPHNARVRSVENALEANHADDSRSISSANRHPRRSRRNFVSLELGEATWLVTTLSPCSEKMSRHTVTGGDITGLFSCFTALPQKVKRRKNAFYPLVVIQEGDWMASDWDEY